MPISAGESKSEPEFIEEREQLSKDSGFDAVAPTAEPIDHHYPETLGAPIAAMRAKILTDVIEHRNASGVEVEMLSYLVG